MHVALVTSTKVPAIRYGGAERIIYWLARALTERGHTVTLLAAPGSSSTFANVVSFDPAVPIMEQLPKGVDIVHAHSGFTGEVELPFCVTMHGNLRAPETLHQNTIFCSPSHARNHNAQAYVLNGVDERAYVAAGEAPRTDRIVFLGKASWRVKNVKGAIRVARKAGFPIDVLGGSRINFKMGFRLTLDPNARFHGMADDEMKQRILPGARCMLAPSLWNEPGAVALIEAMYFGLPIMATPYGCHVDMIPPLAGVLSNSAEELAEAVRRADSFDRRAIRDFWRKTYTIERVARDYETIYERIISGESLHPGPIAATPARGKELLEWKE